MKPANSDIGGAARLRSWLYHIILAMSAGSFRVYQRSAASLPATRSLGGIFIGAPETLGDAASASWSCTDGKQEQAGDPERAAHPLVHMEETMDGAARRSRDSQPREPSKQRPENRRRTPT